MTRKLVHCPKCGKNSLVQVENDKIIEKIEGILKSRKGVYEKKTRFIQSLKEFRNRRN